MYSVFEEECLLCNVPILYSRSNMEIARYWLVLSSSTGPIWDRAGAPAFGAATYVTYQLYMYISVAGIAILHFDSIWAEKKLFSDWLPEFLHHLCVDLFECSICLACAFLDAQDTKRGLFEVPTPTYILHLLATRCIAAPTQCGASATPPPIRIWSLRASHGLPIFHLGWLLCGPVCPIDISQTLIPATSFSISPQTPKIGFGWWIRWAPNFGGLSYWPHFYYIHHGEDLFEMCADEQHATEIKGGTP